MSLTKLTIVGGQHSGRSTFLALMYEAQIRRSNELVSDRRGEFRFHSAPEVTALLSRYARELKMGRWIAPELKQTFENVKFELGFVKGGLFHHASNREAFSIIELECNGIWTDERSAHLTNRMPSRPDFLVILLDGKDVLEGRGSNSIKLLDEGVSAILDRAHRSGAKEPIFVLTRTDSKRIIELVSFLEHCSKSPRRKERKNSSKDPASDPDRPWLLRSLLDQFFPGTLASLDRASSWDVSKICLYYAGVQVDEIDGCPSIDHDGQLSFQFEEFALLFKKIGMLVSG